jgi:hypothetical protein
MREIRLEDGSLLEVKINFLTLKLIVDEDLQKIVDKFKKSPSDKIKMKLASKIIYVILRSNGKKVDEEEALMLIPIDEDQIMNLFYEFEEKLENFKKKQENKIQIPKT